MTEEEREEIKKAKINISTELFGVEVSRYGLSQVDERIEEYVVEVCKNPNQHNLYEQLSVKRFFEMCEKYGLNILEIRKFFTFYESLYFPGKTGQQRYKLTPVQAFQFASIYGFWHNGRRVVREAVLFVPRKFSKTTSSAAFAVYDLLFGDANAESYTGANSADQAKKCFDVIRGCMRRLDPQGARYRINEQTVKSLRKDRNAFAQCLTANARTKDGLNASTVIMDEFSQARDSQLLSVLTTSMGVRENPLTVIITTASEQFEGPFYEMLNGYKRILLGDMENDSVFAHIFEPDLGDPEDSELTWQKVHPHMGVTVSLDFYRQEYTKAVCNGADAMLAFRTKLLNVYAENSKKAWITGQEARAISRNVNLADIKGYPDAMMAIDLSERDDFSAITTGIYNPDGARYHFHTDYFFPEGALKGHPNERMYAAWAKAGHLHLTQGEVMNYEEIVEYVFNVNERVRLLGIGYDPYKSLEVVNMLHTLGAGSVLQAVRQTYGTFTAPVGGFEHGALTGRITINDNPINWFCFSNATLDYDNLENCKPVKRTHNLKIDGVITTLMSMRLFIDSLR